MRWDSDVAISYTNWYRWRSPKLSVHCRITSSCGRTWTTMRTPCDGRQTMHRLRHTLHAYFLLLLQLLPPNCWIQRMARHWMIAHDWTLCVHLKPIRCIVGFFFILSTVINSNSKMYCLPKHADFIFLQGRVATRFKCDGKYDKHFIESLLLSPTVKKTENRLLLCVQVIPYSLRK